MAARSVLIHNYFKSFHFHPGNSSGKQMLLLFSEGWFLERHTMSTGWVKVVHSVISRADTKT